MEQLLNSIAGKPINWFSCLFLLGFFSCTELIPIPKNKGMSGHVLVTFLSCGDSISGKFFQSNTLWNNEIQVNKEYSARLSWDSDTIDATVVGDIFRFDAVALPDTKYKITVICGEDTITGRTDVPDSPHIRSANYAIRNIVSEYGEPVVETDVRFCDNSTHCFEAKYFYGDLQGERDYIFEFQMLDLMPVTNSFLLDEGYLDFNPSTLIFNVDKHADSIIVLDLNYKASAYSSSGNQYVPDSGFVVLRSVSVDYYRFIKTLIKHKYNQSSTESSGSSEFDYYSFFKKGEPVEVYSNVSGGIGIVAAYSETISNFTLEP